MSRGARHVRWTLPRCGPADDGGKGRVLGAVLGLLLIHETREFVSWHWKQSELNLIVMGALLIGTLLLERVLSRKQTVA